LEREGVIMLKEKYEGCEVNKYLERIGYADSPQINIETLGALQECHVKTVPYNG
jgi:arylamine N-acetyltransferase